MKEYKVYNSHNISHANGYIKFAYHTRAYILYILYSRLASRLVSGRYIGDLASRLGIWQADCGSGRQIGDLAGRLGIWPADCGSSRQIGDLACPVYSILGIWKVYWGSGRQIVIVGQS